MSGVTLVMTPATPGKTGAANSGKTPAGAGKGILPKNGAFDEMLIISKESKESKNTGPAQIVPLPEKKGKKADAAPELQLNLIAGSSLITKTALNDTVKKQKTVIESNIKMTQQPEERAGVNGARNQHNDLLKPKIKEIKTPSGDELAGNAGSVNQTKNNAGKMSPAIELSSEIDDKLSARLGNILKDRLNTGRKDDSFEIKIALRPEELGRIEIKVSYSKSDNSLDVQISGSSSALQQFSKNDIAVVQSFRDSGMLFSGIRYLEKKNEDNDDSGKRKREQGKKEQEKKKNIFVREG